MKRGSFIILFLLSYNLLSQNLDTVKWVASWGDDINGTGESFNPYKTIKKAL